MEPHNNSGSSDSSVYLGAYNQHKSYHADNTITQSYQSISTEPITIDFTTSVISLSIPSHYFVSNTTLSNVDTIRITEGIPAENSTHFPLFIRGYELIKVPNKVEAALKRIGKRKLQTIHEDPEVARELCLVFLSNLTDTYFRMLGLGFDDTIYNQEGWKSLSSHTLREQFSHAMTYRRIIDVLLEGTSKGPIIECDEKCMIGEKCFGYRLGEAYRLKGVASYTIKTEYVLQLQASRQNKRVLDVYSNPISRGLMQGYSVFRVPSEESVEQRGRALAKNKWRTKKGKVLTVMNKNHRTYWRNPHERSFLEDNMEIFNYLTDGGLLIPTPGGEKSGGRVVDSFTLMPSWQRQMIEIEGEKIVGVDYRCLHPNICMTLYEGDQKHLTHDYVSSISGIENARVKKAHLSFFNKDYNQMLNSPLWTYYASHHTDMLGKIVEEKGSSEYGYKITSRKLFQKEVEIMTDVFIELYSLGIAAGYVYDAIFCKQQDAFEVKRIMDNVVLQHGVYTSAKIDLG